MLILRLVWPTYHNLHVLTCQLIDSPLIVGWDVVCGWFYPVSYGVAAFVCYPYVCVSEQVRDLAYLWGNVCESRPFLVFSVLW